jgi:hypothetical protein
VSEFARARELERSRDREIDREEIEIEITESSRRRERLEACDLEERQKELKSSSLRVWSLLFAILILNLGLKPIWLLVIILFFETQCIS